MKRELKFSTELTVKAETAYAWHEHDSAFNRLSPPWDQARMLRTQGIKEGGRAHIELTTPLGQVRWLAEHFNVQVGKSFSDRQLSGPFAFWQHTHSFEPSSTSSCVLHDTLQYELPLSPLSDFFAGAFVRNKLSAMFRYRHSTLRNDLAFWSAFEEKKVKRILVTGSTGLIGQELSAFLRQGGYEVIGVSRQASKQASQVQWDLSKARPDECSVLLDGAPLDAVIHLAGEGIAEGRWTERQKEKLRSSRVEATHNLITGLQKLGLKPSVFISASGIGIYGDRSDEVLNEHSVAGNSFLSQLAVDWERAARSAEDVFGARVIQFRMGSVLTPRGGALAKMLLPFRLGMGGPLGHGRQWMSWVALDDVLYAMAHALETLALNGPVNLVSPHHVTNREFTRALASVLRRPALFPVPSTALRVMFGEMADELLLGSQKAVPEALLNSGFQFRHAELEEALRHMLGKSR
jgi:uncharacterized protein